VTVADLMTGVVGLAAGMAFEPVRWEFSRVIQTCGFFVPAIRYDSAFWTVARAALPALIGLMAVMLARRARYGGQPGAAECLTLALLLALLDVSIPSGEQVGGPMTTRPMEYLRTADGVWVPARRLRPSVVTALEPSQPLVLALGTTLAMLSAAALAGATLWRASKGQLPGGLTLILAAGTGWLCLRYAVRLNPIEVMRGRFSWVSVRPTALPDGWSAAGFSWYVEARMALGRWSYATLVAIPALIAFRRTTRPGSRWTDWASVSLGACLGAGWFIDELGLRPWPEPVVRLTVFLALASAVAIPAWFVAGRLERRVEMASRGSDQHRPVNLDPEKSSAPMAAAVMAPCVDPAS
jgi:hypothetical protein